MASHVSRFTHQCLHKFYADILAVIILLSLSALYSWLTWTRCGRGPFGDPGWYMQVADRVAAGEVLYRDTLWIYGPLPVYVLALLYRLLGVNMTVLSLLYQILAVLACLLTYRAARFLLSAPLALLVTVAVFLGGWWGGFLSYIQTYTGAVSLGAVLGLLFVVCLLSYLKSQWTPWLIAAGGTTGGAFLTKPEFALACVGTGLLFLTQIILFPASFASRRSCGIRTLAIYVVSTAFLLGIGYGVLAYQAGWQHVWAGISGYDQANILTWAIPPWGTPWSWCHIISGLGVNLLVVLALIGTLAPAMIRKRMPLMCALLVLCVVLIALPWGYQFLTTPGLLSNMMALPTFAQIGVGLQIVLAPGTLLLAVLVIAMSIRWFKAYRRKKTIDQIEQFYAVFAMYSALVVARYYFNPTVNIKYGLLPQYMDTLFPMFVFSLVVLVPRVMERWEQIRPRRFRAQCFLTIILLACVVVGFILDMWGLSQMNFEVRTPRGTVLMDLTHPLNRARVETLQYIVSHTEPEDSIVVLGTDPGFYFLGGRKNPLRQDYILPGLGSSPADAHEIVERLKMHSPKLTIIPKQIEKHKALSGWPASEVRQEYYENLMPVWQYVYDHYRVRTVVGGAEWGYTIYEPLDY